MEASFSKKALVRFKHPRNYEELEEPDGHAIITGPCGDTMEFWLQVDDGIATAVSFITTGCGPSRACGSMATELAEGKTIPEIMRIEQQDILDALDGMPEEHQHCALLASNTLKAAVEDFMKHQQNDKTNAQGSCSACDKDSCSAKNQRQNESLEEFLERQALQERMCHIRHKILVLSGKGGVGKSTVAANLAVSLSLAGKRVGLLDVDIHGPSIPKMFHLEGEAVTNDGDSIVPVEVGDIKVLSIGFFLGNRDDAVIWRGPMKMGVIKQFLKDTAWGELDYLVIDSPPGTGDEPLSVCQLVEDADGAVIVTTPQDVSVADVRRSIRFCQSLRMPVLGVVENMSGFVCPRCGEVTNIFKSGGGEQMALEMGIPFLGRIPLDPQIGEACDAGKPYIHQYARSETAKAFQHAIKPILALDGGPTPSSTITEDIQKMRIAIPIANGQLAMHFGHCEEFALVDVDQAAKCILKTEKVEAPEHQPGLLPRWLAEKGANVIIAGGMGSRAQALFEEQNIHVIIGAPADTVENLVKAFLDGILQSGENICDH